MKKMILLLMIVLLVAGLFAKDKKLKDTKFFTWDTAAEFSFAFLSAAVPPIFTIGAGDGSIGIIWLSPIVNYGKELVDWAYYEEFNWKDTGVRTVGMAIPMILWYGAMGVTIGTYDFGNGNTGKIVIGWNFDLPRPSKPFKLRNLGG